MKKSLLIIMLCAIQSACASQGSAPANTAALLSYADLATEITVGYEDLADRNQAIQSDDEPVDTP